MEIMRLIKVLKANRSLRIGHASRATIAGSVANIREAALADRLSSPAVEQRYAAPGSSTPNEPATANSLE
jgi:hypothetical protein